MSNPKMRFGSLFILMLLTLNGCISFGGCLAEGEGLDPEDTTGRYGCGSSVSTRPTPPIDDALDRDNLTNIILAPRDLELASCSATHMMTATAVDSDENPIHGVPVEFFFVDSLDSDIFGLFTPNPAHTNPVGEATTTLELLSSDCKTRCGNGNQCTGTIQARNRAKTVLSDPAVIIDKVP